MCITYYRKKYIDISHMCIYIYIYTHIYTFYMYMYSIYYYMCRNAIDTHWYFMEFLWPDRPVRVTNVRTPFDQFSFTSYLKVDHHLQAGCRGTFSFWINPPHCPFQTKKLPPCFSPYHFSTAQNNRNFRSRQNSDTLNPFLSFWGFL